MMVMTTTRRRIPPLFQPSPPKYHRRTLAAWWRDGDGDSDSGTGTTGVGKSSVSQQSSLVAVDVSKKRHYPVHIVNDEYPVSICSIQGYRVVMEDKFTIHTTAAPTNSATNTSTANNTSTSTTTTSTTANHQHDPIHQDHIHGIVACFDGHGGKAVSRYLRKSLYTNLLAALNMIQHTTPKQRITMTVDDYVSALEVALDKVNREVLKVQHWKRQGSTAVVCWIHTEETTNVSSPVGGDRVVQPTTNTEPPPPSPPRTSATTTRTLITANVGDSRAILCRNGMAIPLSRDHKPMDPIEFHRIHRVGGTVDWVGEVDLMQEPIPGMGCYRVNGSLSLSRMIGDRSQRPVVNSDPEITLITLVPSDDEFIVVATDGLWDVMSSSDTVAFIRALRGNMDQDAIDRDSIASYVVEEALRRGSLDNITVIIVWLQ